MAAVKPDDLAGAIADALTEYGDEVAEGTFRAVDQVTEETAAEIGAHLTFTRRKGDKYVRSFAVKTSFKDKRNKRNTWYVKAPHYRLTHLLEYGHRTRDGGRTRAFPHIRYGEELAARRLPELMEKVLKGG